MTTLIRYYINTTIYHDGQAHAVEAGEPECWHDELPEAISALDEWINSCAEDGDAVAGSIHELSVTLPADEANDSDYVDHLFERASQRPPAAIHERARL